ncbi:MAG: endonuclease/exonuclease/phosphatase family protein [Candidatus Paceibacterota bacterium]
MKLINLNIQGGVAYESLIEFIKRHAQNTDFFCFQEVFHHGIVKRWLLENARPDIFSEIQDILQNFNGYYANPKENDIGGLAIFIKKDFFVEKVGNIVLFEELNTTTDETDKSYFAMGRNLQSLQFNHLGKTYIIFNFHGMWIFKNKTDTEKRILQSEKIKKIFDESKGAKILCTDLNVEPNTKSVAILNEGNINLIEEYKITSTRSLSKNRPEIVDYVITSPEIKVSNFEVLKDEVSDHLPLLLDFK